MHNPAHVIFLSCSCYNCWDGRGKWPPLSGNINHSSTYAHTHAHSHFLTHWRTVNCCQLLSWIQMNIVSLLLSGGFVHLLLLSSLALYLLNFTVYFVKHSLNSASFLTIISITPVISLFRASTSTFWALICIDTLSLQCTEPPLLLLCFFYFVSL